MLSTSQNNFILLYNKNSGGGETNSLIHKIIQLLTNFNFNIEVKEIQSTAETSEFIATVYKQGKRNFFVAGGDGSLFYFINAIMANYQLGDLPVNLGIIPIGTGNALYSSVVSYEENRNVRLRDSILKFKQGNLRNLDLMQLTDINNKIFYACNLLSFGIGGRSVEIRNQYLNNLGKIGYNIALIMEVLGKTTKNKFNLKIDGKNILQQCSFMGVYNSRYIGNKWDISPFSQIDDGFGEILFIDYKQKISTLNNMLSVEKGEHLFLDNVIYSQFQEIEFLENENQIPLATILDGEFSKIIPKKIKMLPSVMKLFC